jgi:Na+/melibiose symporter-like transporter
VFNSRADMMHVTRTLARLSLPGFLVISVLILVPLLFWYMTGFADEHRARIAGATSVVGVVVWVAFAWTWIVARERRPRRKRN